VTRSGQQHLVFDVGGTQLRGAVYDEGSGALAAVSRVNAPSHASDKGASWAELRGRLLDAMSSVRAALDPDGRISSAVVAFPGPVDAERRVLAAPTLWGSLGSYPHPLEHDLREAWGTVDVCVTNDVTAAGYRYVEPEGEDFCIVTISSGIGNKIFVRGRPLVGPSGQGGEIGHLQVDPSLNAPRCDCGARGHLGAIASGRGMLARAKDQATAGGDFERSSLRVRMGLEGHALTAEALAGAYRENDAWATAVVREGADSLGAVLAAIHLAIGVERFVLIGGFALGLGAPFCDDVRTSLLSRCWQGASVRISLGASDGHCALVGGGRARQLGLLP